MHQVAAQCHEGEECECETAMNVEEEEEEHGMVNVSVGYSNEGW
jgi:hypothetical protein